MYQSISGSQALSRRAVALGSIVALHLLVISLIASGLGKQFAQLVAPPLEASVIKETIPPEVSPPVRDPTLYVPKSEPVPEPFFPFDTEQGETALTPVPEPPAPPQVDARPIPPQPIRLIGRNKLPNTDDFYPPRLIREGIEGAAIVQACVDGNGVRRGEPTIEQTSGDVRLDEAAIRVARAGQFARAMQGDTPVPACHRFHIGFTLK